MNQREFFSTRFFEVYHQVSCLSEQIKEETNMVLQTLSEFPKPLRLIDPRFFDTIDGEESLHQITVHHADDYYTKIICTVEEDRRIILLSYHFFRGFPDIPVLELRDMVKSFQELSIAKEYLQQHRAGHLPLKSLSEIPRLYILRVDDNDFDLALTEHVLDEMEDWIIESTGQRPCIKRCQHGEEAFDFIFDNKIWPDGQKGQLPHLIISDIDMPYMNGIELLKSIRSTNKTSDIPFYIMSNCLPNQQSTLADGYFHKPYEYDHLKQQFLELMSLYQQKHGQTSATASSFADKLFAA